MPTGNNDGSAKINNRKAIAEGLSFRPLVDTVKDTYDWWNSGALTPEQRTLVESDPKSILVREQSIIEAWKVM